MSSMSKDFEVIIYEKQDGIAYITLNRPKALNAYNIKMRDELYEVLGVIKEDSEVEVVILKGAGEKAFCAGADLTEFLTAPPPVLGHRSAFKTPLKGGWIGRKKTLKTKAEKKILPPPQSSPRR